jgi:DeoR/GlpR family transcriptional regulator of sugar metabolism
MYYTAQTARPIEITTAGPVQMASRRVKDERQLRLGYLIANLLSGHEIRVEQLQAFGEGVDERTARGDLIAVSHLRVRRFRGGIAPASELFHFAQRLNHIEAKQDIAQFAAKLFSAHASTAASPGTTVALTYAEMLEQGIAPVIVTNSLALVEYAPLQGFPVYLLGGEYNADIHALIGRDAEDGFRRLAPCRHGLLGVSGITVTSDLRASLYVKHDAERRVLQAMLDAVTEKLIIVADVHKLGRGDPWQIGTITDLAVDEREVAFVTNHCDDWNKELDSHYDAAKQTCERLAELEQNLRIQNTRFQLHLVPRATSNPENSQRNRARASRPSTNLRRKVRGFRLTKRV